MTDETLDRIIQNNAHESELESVSIVARSTDGLQLEYRPDALHRSASLIKVPIMMTILDAVRHGSLTLDQLVPAPAPAGGSGVLQILRRQPYSVGDLLALMIVVSDNMATNALINLVGMPAVNDWSDRAGLTETVLGRHMMASADSSRGRENFTTARDMALILDGVSAGRLPDSNDALGILLGQQSDGGLPEYLPDGWMLAHKTGELDGLRHDAGIVMTEADHRATVVVMCDGFGGVDGTARASSVIRAVGREVYERLGADVEADD